MPFRFTNDKMFFIPSGSNGSTTYETESGKSWIPQTASAVLIIESTAPDNVVFSVVSGSGSDRASVPVFEFSSSGQNNFLGTTGGVTTVYVTMSVWDMTSQYHSVTASAENGGITTIPTLANIISVRGAIKNDDATLLYPGFPIVDPTNGDVDVLITGVEIISGVGIGVGLMSRPGGFFTSADFDANPAKNRGYIEISYKLT